MRRSRRRRRIDSAACPRRGVRAADKHLLLRIAVDHKTGAAQHRHRASPVRHPPIGVVAGIAALDEMQLWKARPVENGSFGERVVLFERLLARIAALHRLTDEQIFGDVFADQIERQQRMAQVVEHPEEQDDVKPLTERADIVHRQLCKFDVARRASRRRSSLAAR